MSEEIDTPAVAMKRFVGGLIGAIGLIILCLSGLCTLWVGLSSIPRALSGQFSGFAAALVWGGPAICTGVLLAAVGMRLERSGRVPLKPDPAHDARARLIRGGLGVFLLLCAVASPLPALAIWNEPYARPGLTGIVIDAVPPLVLGLFLLFTSRRPREFPRPAGETFE